MRPDAAPSLDGGTAVFLSLLALLFPLGALVYCTGGKHASAARTAAASDKSKSVTKSFMGTSHGMANPEEKPAEQDYRAQWATAIVETQTIKSIWKEFDDCIKEYKAPGRSIISFEAHKTLNRYTDIACFDQGRVILKGPSDYINANYMNAPDGVKYIATQGPMNETISDFWQMVVQEEALIVLQLCKFVEGTEEKCAEYWPFTEKETAKELDKFTIRKIDKQEEIAPGTVKTKLRIESKTVNRTISHIFCDSWPDKLAPSDPAIIINIWNYVKSNRGAGPVVVHCSAGVGRTATFIGLSFGLEMLKKQGATLVDVVRELRSYRLKAVQTQIQYIFLHVALLEMFIQMSLIPRSTQVATFFTSFRKTVERLVEKKEKTDKSNNSAEVQSGGK